MRRETCLWLKFETLQKDSVGKMAAITAVCKYDDSKHLLRKKKNKLSKPNHCRDAILNHHHDKQLDIH
jgi:hypothetical protein